MLPTKSQPEVPELQKSFELPDIEQLCQWFKSGYERQRYSNMADATTRSTWQLIQQTNALIEQSRAIIQRAKDADQDVKRICHYTERNIRESWGVRWSEADSGRLP